MLQKRGHASAGRNLGTTPPGEGVSGGQMRDPLAALAASLCAGGDQRRQAKASNSNMTPAAGMMGKSLSKRGKAWRVWELKPPKES